MFVDSHAHLDSPEFEADLEDVLKRAVDEQVDTILTIGCLDANAQAAWSLLELVDSRPSLYAAFGVHPHDADLYDGRLESRLLHLLDHPKVLGVGEVGLDYYYNRSPRKVQQAVFREQIRIAKSVGKPIIVHTRDAQEDTIRILEENFADTGQDVGIMHCFSGTWEMAERSVALGFLLSFGGILTFKNADSLRETAGRLAGDRILIETDSPYLAPVPVRGKRNEPAYLKWVAEKLGSVRGISTQKAARLTAENFQRLFR